MKLKYIAAAFMALASSAINAQEQQYVGAFPQDMVANISSAFNDKTFTITLTNKCVVIGRIVEDQGAQIIFDKKGFICPDQSTVALSETRYYINKL